MDGSPSEVAPLRPQAWLLGDFYCLADGMRVALLSVFSKKKSRFLYGMECSHRGKELTFSFGAVQPVDAVVAAVFQDVSAAESVVAQERKATLRLVHAEGLEISSAWGKFCR